MPVGERVKVICLKHFRPACRGCPIQVECDSLGKDTQADGSYSSERVETINKAAEAVEGY